MKNPELFAALRQLHADRAALDASLVSVLAEAAAEEEPVAARGILFPLPLLLDREAEFKLEPGCRVELRAPVVPYASYALVGFRVISDAPIPTAIQIEDLMIGGGCNLLFAEDWTPIEAYRTTIPVPLRFPRTIVQPPNSTSLKVRYLTHPHPAGKTGIQLPVRFSIVLDVEVTEDQVMGFKLSSGAWKNGLPMAGR